MPIIQRIEVRCDLMGFLLFYFMENEVEVWKYIKGYEGIYRISNLGNVFSVLKNILLRPNYDTDGYVQYGLNINSKRKMCKGHHLVVRAFIDPDFKTMNGLVCDHINRVRDDNRATNLRIVSHRENAINKSSKHLSGVRCDRGVYQANINYNGKKYYLGIFNTEQDAHNKYMEAFDLINKGCFDYEKVRVVRKIKSSIYKGVFFCKTTNKWIGRAKVSNRRKRIGVFATEEEAHFSVLKIERELNLLKEKCGLT